MRAPAWPAAGTRPSQKLGARCSPPPIGNSTPRRPFNKPKRTVEQAARVASKNYLLNPYVLDAVKQIALYRDACGECHWSFPDAVVDEVLARMIFDIARLFVKEEPGAMTSAAELALWVKHMKFVWKGDMTGMKSALVACYAEAKELGLLKGKQTVGDMVKFVL